MADNNPDDPNPASVAKGLNSVEIRKNDNIQFVDENVELDDYLRSEEGTTDNIVVHQVPKINKVGLNSPVIQKSESIPYADENIGDGNIEEPARPARQRELEKNGDLNNSSEVRPQIHASDIGEIHSSPGSDTIVVSTPEGTLYITLTDSDHSRSSKTTSPTTTTATLSGDPCTSKTQVPNESKILIDHEKEADPIEKRTNLTRRNSISMPTLQNLDQNVIRQQNLSPRHEVRCNEYYLYFF